MSGTERYTHHGQEVTVLSEVKGRHRDLCLCYRCLAFNPISLPHCPIAVAVYEVCVMHGLVTPVFECPEFAAKKAAPAVTAHEQQFES